MKITGSVGGNLQLAPQLNSGHAAKMNVEEQTIDLGRGAAGEEFFCRYKQPG